MSFKYTTAVKKLRAMRARKKVVQGGTSAGKTQGIIAILIDLACRSKLKITVVCETIPAAKDGPVDIFKSIMHDTNRWREDGWIGSPMEYTFANGSRIQFKAFDTVGKAKAAGKRDILFLNEANEIAYDIADTLMIRSKETWMDFNADLEFWAHTEVMKEPNSELLILTYEDNEALPEETLEDLLIKKSRAYHDINGNLDAKENIKSEYWHNWWKVFGKGLIGNISELRIMPIIMKCTEVPNDAIRIPSSLDFGWFPHPTYFGENFVRKGDLMDDLYIVPRIYDTRLSINSRGEGAVNLVDKLKEKGVNPLDQIIAECADPRAVDDMRMANFSIESVRKERVETSIRKFHEYNIYVVFTGDNEKEAQAVYNEFDGYKFDKDKQTNTILKVPAPDQDDHGIDGTRYVIISRNLRWSI